MNTKAEIFVYRDSDVDSGTVEFLTVRQDESWGILPAEMSAAEHTLSLSEPGFYAVPAWAETVDLADNISQLWVCYGGLQGILEFKRNGAQAALAELGDRLAVANQSCPAGTFHSAEWAVVVAKPDALERGIEADMRAHLAQAGLSEIAVTEPRQLKLDDIEQLWVPPYKWEQPQPAGDWWYATVDYMKSGPSVAYLVTGSEATEKAKAVKAELRREYDCNPHHDDERPVEERVRSLMHCTDRTEELVRNAALFWEPRDLLAMIADAKRSKA